VIVDFCVVLVHFMPVRFVQNPRLRLYLSQNQLVATSIYGFVISFSGAELFILYNVGVT
jgi:hypothetical protein